MFQKHLNVSSTIRSTLDCVLLHSTVLFSSTSSLDLETLSLLLYTTSAKLLEHGELMQLLSEFSGRFTLNFR